MPPLNITIISDTHGEHEKLGVLSGDVLIHCGDMFNMFSTTEDEFERIDEWFGRQQFELILCIGGNHDFELEKRSAYVSNPFRNAIYLEGTAHEYKGLRFFGAPWIPGLHGQAFFRQDSDLKRLWSDIPGDTDVLVTHTPPANILDVSSRGLQLGCEHLAAEIAARAPTLHCFGHVHASSGSVSKDRTTFVNAALVNSQYQLTRAPYEVSL